MDHAAVLALTDDPCLKYAAIEAAQAQSILAHELELFAGYVSGLAIGARQGRDVGEDGVGFEFDRYIDSVRRCRSNVVRLRAELHACAFVRGQA
jgi:hypothetical protein